MAKYTVGDKVTIPYQGDSMRYVKILHVTQDYRSRPYYFGTYVSGNGGIDEENMVFFNFSEDQIGGIYDEKVTITISKQTYDLLREQLK